MSTEYTPTTKAIRDVHLPFSSRAPFDRWLAEHDRQTAEQAWDEGFDAYEADHLHHDAHGWGDEECATVTHNPYRKRGVA